VLCGEGAGVGEGVHRAEERGRKVGPLKGRRLEVLEMGRTRRGERKGLGRDVSAVGSRESNVEKSKSFSASLASYAF
jgi:hypothetical protein